MPLIAAGVSHRTAPVEEREQLAVSAAELGAALISFRSRFGQAVILSTCNRTEVYVSRRGCDAHPAELLYHLADFKGLGRPSLPRFYELTGLEVAQHLFRVSAGIDSMILGEGQILGQVRGALHAARQAQTLDACLSRLFHAALETGKRARHETEIGRFAVSVSSAAVALARRRFASFRDCRALVVGAGEVGKMTAHALRDAGVEQIVVTSRTHQRALDLATLLGGTTIPFDQLVQAIAEADLVITSSGAGGFLIGPQQVEEALARREAPIVFIDVAVPRDVDPAAAAVPGAQIVDIDDLQTVSEANLRLRERAAGEVERVVGEAVAEFAQWLDTRRAVPTIATLVDHADRIRRSELERTIHDLRLDAEDAYKLDHMTAAIVKKLLHAPIEYLKDGDSSEDACRVVRRLFALKDE